jgi:hypothetical protein
VAELSLRHYPAWSLGGVPVAALSTVTLVWASSAARWARSSQDCAISRITSYPIGSEMFREIFTHFAA